MVTESGVAAPHASTHELGASDAVDTLMTIADLTASTADGTVYQNTGSSVLWIQVSGYHATGSEMFLYSDASTPPTTVVSKAQPDSAHSGFLIAPILPSHYWKTMNVTGGWNVISWRT